MIEGREMGGTDDSSSVFKVSPLHSKFWPSPEPHPLNLTTVSPSHATSRYGVQERLPTL